MKKKKLEAGDNFDFHLIGIVSQSRDYTVSWSINKLLNIGLKKEEDLTVELKKVGKLLVSNFVFEDDFRRFTLLTNKILSDKNEITTQKLLIPSLGTFDYLLKIEEFDETSDLDIIYSNLRNSAAITMLMKFDVSKVKEKESLLF